MKLLLAAAIAAAAIAGAASAETARVSFGDLNLSTASGVAALDARIEAGARTMCRNATRTGSRLSETARCTAAFRAEVLSQLPAEARAQYSANRQPITL